MFALTTCLDFRCYPLKDCFEQFSEHLSLKYNYQWQIQFIPLDRSKTGTKNEIEDVMHRVQLYFCLTVDKRLI